MFGGMPCEGSSDEFAQCEASDKQATCPVYIDYTQLPYKLKRLLSKFLDSSRNSYVIDENTNLTLSCNSSVTLGLNYFYENSGLLLSYEWYHNGGNFKSR